MIFMVLGQRRSRDDAPGEDETRISRESQFGALDQRILARA